MNDTNQQVVRLSMRLPPKRFEDDRDAKFDSIRWKPWFPALAERRAKIPLLAAAADVLSQSKTETQKSVAEWFTVDDRELRDYMAFRFDKWPKPSPTFQRILDDAYEIYCLNKAVIGLRHCIDRVAGYYGKNPRHVMEEFEVNPTFVPKGYVYQPAATNGCKENDQENRKSAKSQDP